MNKTFIKKMIKSFQGQSIFINGDICHAYHEDHKEDIFPQINLYIQRINPKKVLFVCLLYET